MTGITGPTPPTTGITGPTPPTIGITGPTPPTIGITGPTPPMTGITGPTPPTGQINQTQVIIQMEAMEAIGEPKLDNKSYTIMVIFI